MLKWNAFDTKKCDKIVLFSPQKKVYLPTLNKVSSTSESIQRIIWLG